MDCTDSYCACVCHQPQQKAKTWGDFIEFMQTHPMDQDFVRDLEAIHNAFNQPIGGVGVWQDSEN